MGLKDRLLVMNVICKKVILDIVWDLYQKLTYIYSRSWALFLFLSVQFFFINVCLPKKYIKCHNDNELRCIV